MPTLIVASRSEACDRAMSEAARASGWSVVIGDVVPTTVTDPVVYVAADLALTLASQLDVALLEPPFDLLSRVPERFVRRAVEMATFADLERLQAPTFVKPADPLDRWFDAGTYSDVRDIRTKGRVSPECPVILSEPVSWSAEYRYFVFLNERERPVSSSPRSPQGQGHVVAASHYLSFGRPIWKPFDPKRASIIPPVGQTLVEDLCTQMRDHLPPAFVVDVGIIEEGGWAVVEFNPVWCAGLLGADPRRLLPLLRRTTRKRHEVTAEDARWVVSRQ